MTAKTSEQLRKSIVEAIVNTGIAHGELELDGLSDAERDDTISEYIADFISQPQQMTGTVDHRPKLLKSARQSASDGDYQFASLFYATWIEHWANGIVTYLAARAGHPDDRITCMIRDTPLRGKLVWLIPLLGGTEIAKKHTTAILDLCNNRNGFVHYKWRPQQVDCLNITSPEMIAAVDRFPATVKYLQRYENAEIFGDRKGVAKQYAKAESE